MPREDFLPTVLVALGDTYRLAFRYFDRLALDVDGRSIDDYVAEIDVKALSEVNFL